MVVYTPTSISVNSLSSVPFALNRLQGYPTLGRTTVQAVFLLRYSLEYGVFAYTTGVQGGYCIFYKCNVVNYVACRIKFILHRGYPLGVPDKMNVVQRHGIPVQ